MKDVFTLIKPKNPLPLVFDSPHSGQVYPADFKHDCVHAELQRTEDRYVDDLFSSAPEHGGTFLMAHFPRCYIDPNRRADDIDPALLDGPWPNGDIAPTARSDAGIGLIRRIVRPGVTVYDQPLSPAEITRRIEKYYRPYHKALEDAIDETHYKFGQVWHINCHSMPAASAFPKRPVSFLGHGPSSVDFVLSDRDGTTCGADFSRTLRDFIKGLGYTVTMNDPYKGVELIRRYSAPTRGRHSLQIEINKALYLDEATQEKNENYPALKADIEKIITFCARYAEAQLKDLAAD